MTLQRARLLQPSKSLDPDSALAPIGGLPQAEKTLVDVSRPSTVLRPMLWALALTVATSFAGSASAALSLGQPTAGGRQSGVHSGTLAQGYLGVDIRDVTADRAAALKLKSPTGAEIIHVDHDGPAGKAGLRIQDVVLSMNGQTISSEAQLRRMLRETPAGGNVTLIVSRDGEQQTVRTQLADRAVVERQAWLQHMTVPPPEGAGYPAANPSAAASASTNPPVPPRSHGSGFLGAGSVSAPTSLPASSGVTNPSLPSPAPANPTPVAPPDPQSHSLIGSLMLGSSYTGAVLEMIGPQLAQFFGAPSAPGLLVRSVDPNSPAAVAGLRAGDVVLRANSVAVSTPAAWSRLVRENRGKQLAVVVLREHQEQTLRLVPDGKRRSSRNESPVDSLDHSLRSDPPGTAFLSAVHLLAPIKRSGGSIENELNCTIRTSCDV